MNERIAKLYEQAIVLEGNGDYVAGELDPVKFTELIVNETADWINDNVGMIDEDARADLLKHFGINRE